MNGGASALSDVAVSILLTLHTLQIFFLDQDVDALLDDLNFRLEACRELVEDFVDELRVIECFAHLHDANDGGFNQQLSVFFDVLVCNFLFSLLFRFQWEVDVDAKFLATN